MQGALDVEGMPRSRAHAIHTSGACFVFCWALCYFLAACSATESVAAQSAAEGQPAECISAAKPLLKAARRLDVEAVRSLLTPGGMVVPSTCRGAAPAQLVDADGRTALHWISSPTAGSPSPSFQEHAYFEQKAAAIANVLLVYGANLTGTDVYGMNSLHWCALNGMASLCHHLLSGYQHNAKWHGEPYLDVPEHSNASTPLMLAIVNRHTDVVSTLIAHRANVEARDRFGQTPLMKAAASGLGEAVRTLLEKGDADAGAKDPALGWTACHFAVRMGHVGIAHELVQLHACEDEGVDRQGKTLYSMAAELGHEKFAADLRHRHVARIEASHRAWLQQRDKSLEEL